MSALVLCYAPPDESAARQLGDFLSANLPVDISYDECVISPELDLIQAVERALSAEYALLLLSPDVGPFPPDRAKWEPVLLEQPAELETRLGFVLLRDCRFPQLLRRHYFFDLSAGFVEGARRIRHWMLHPDSGIPLSTSTDILREQLGDRPGVAYDIAIEHALAFAADCASDFESVHRIDARGRTRAGLAGDLAHTFGRPASAAFDGSRRSLIVYENAAPEDRGFLIMPGRASILFTSPSPGSMYSPDAIEGAFFGYPRDLHACQSMLGAATLHMRHLLDTDLAAGLRLAWAILSVLKSAHRIPEAIETLAWMQTAAQQGDAAAELARIEREQFWVTGDETGPLLLPPLEGAQLTLPFA